MRVKRLMELRAQRGKLCGQDRRYAGLWQVWLHWPATVEPLFDISGDQVCQGPRDDRQSADDLPCLWLRNDGITAAAQRLLHDEIKA